MTAMAANNNNNPSSAGNSSNNGGGAAGGLDMMDFDEPAALKPAVPAAAPAAVPATEGTVDLARHPSGIIPTLQYGRVCVRATHHRAP